MKTFKLNYFFLALIIFTCLGFRPKEATTIDVEDKYYQVVLIWVKDPLKFREYGEKMRPIVQKYGGSTERMINPVTSIYSGSYGSSLSQPNILNIVYYHNKEAYENFNKDPEYQSLIPLRDEAIDIVGVGGKSIEGKLIKGEASKRLYMIEFSYFSDSDGSKYKLYKKNSLEFYNRNGVELERSIAPSEVFGNIIDLPNIVNISYIKSGDSSQLQKDSEHHSIQGAFRQAVSNTVWIEGKAALFNMK
ncbi:DUF1330 domain-containing protein [Hanstruepera marina]|uniref:DUF1330 domain-containing protein n=1 Tax=Hanstruepera marina TaxID=2873265 RepID=UPI001CA65362|nr:DUF1330 domain-containing protein [Hanstruepera marina]